MSATQTQELGTQREIAYNAYLSSLEEHELQAYLRANTDNGSSLELQLHDLYVRCEIEEDTIGAWILALLGEI